MADTTTNYGWTVETEYSTDYYDEAVSIRNEIDATVYGIDGRVTTNTSDLSNHESNLSTDIQHLTAAEKTNSQLWDSVTDQTGLKIQDVPDDGEGYGANVVENGCFEDGLTGWSAASGSTLSLDTDEKTCGSQSCNVAVPSGDSRGDIVASVVLEADKIYRINAFVYGDGVVESVQILGGSYASGAIPVVAGWNAISVDMSRNTDGAFQIAGYYTAADQAFSFNVDTITARPVETVAFTDKKTNVITRENAIVHGNDLTQSPWVKTRSSIVETGVQSPVVGKTFQGLVSDTTPNSSHHVYQLFTPVNGAGLAVFEGYSKHGEQPWIRVNNLTTNDYVFIGLEDGEIGSGQGTHRETVRVLDRGIHWRVEMETVAGTNQFLVHSAPANSETGAVSYTGDGATIDTYHIGFNVYEGILEDYISPYDNGASTYPRTLSVEPQDDPALKHAAGYLKTIDGAWVPLSEVDGLLMDETPAAVAYMQQNGLYKAVATGAWGPLVAGIQFYANNGTGNFVELFEGSTASSTSATLTIAVTAPTYFGPIPVHSTGNIRASSQGVGISIPGVSSTTHFAGVSINGTTDSMSLDWGSDMGGAYPVVYSVTVEYIIDATNVPA